MLEELIAVSGLSIGYHHKKKVHRIAQNLGFKVLRGELTAIVGRNGIGKSTLLRTLTKIQPPLGGSIQIDGRSLSGYTRRELARVISIVLTEPLASKNMTVYELIALGRQPYTTWMGTLNSTDRRKIGEVIDSMGLTDISHKKCFELSDGQLQQTLIARALAQDTELIVLDEPTAHLDLHHKVQLMKLLKSITQKTQKTIIFTSHEIELALQLCDKMLLMGDDGCPFGTPEELTENGALSNLFPKENITFDPETKTFHING